MVHPIKSSTNGKKSKPNTDANSNSAAISSSPSLYTSPTPPNKPSKNPDSGRGTRQDVRSLGFVRGLSDKQVAAINSNDRAQLLTADLPTIDGDVASGGFFAGPADLVTEKLLEVQDHYPGLEEINIGITGMGMPESATLEQMHRFAEGVMPHFNNR